jgi:hypothetical protein
MLPNTRSYLGAAALLVSTALPFVLSADEKAAPESAQDPVSAGGDETTHRVSPCSCRSGSADVEEDEAELLKIVEFLHPRWSKESLREGEDFALVYANVPGLPPDMYLLRVYAAGERAFATLVDRRGAETPFDATFEVVGRRSVRIDVNFLGAPTDGDTADKPPSELELDLTCGDDNWILVTWTNDDGSTGWDGECCDGEC